MSTTMQSLGADAALNLVTEFCNDDKIQAGKIMAAAILQGCNADAANTAFREWLEGFCEVIGSMFAAHCYNHQFTIRTVTESEGGEA